MLIDMYNLKARQAPLTFALAPAILAAVAAVPSLQGIWGFLGGVVAALGLPHVLAQAAGNAGKDLEQGLFASWGGKPTTVMLRHRDGRINELTKRAYFDVLRSVGIPMPTPEEESRDPAGADTAYEAAGDWLRRDTRDGKVYPRVKTELTNYGLARNLLGLRWLGLAVAAAALLVQAGIVAMAAVKGVDVTPLPDLSLLFSFGMVGFWLWVVRPGWARRAADAYALALLEACERRKVPSAPKRTASDKKAGAKDAAPLPDRGVGPQPSAAAPEQGTSIQ